MLLASCDDLSMKTLTTDSSDLLTNVDVRSDISEEKRDCFNISSRMAELFLSSQEEDIKIKRIEPYIYEGITCFYVINLEHGFRVVSADTRTQPILAKSDKGSLNLQDLNNGTLLWLEDTADRIKELKRHNPKTKEDYSDFWKHFDSSIGIVNTTRSQTPNQDSIWVKVVTLSITPTYSCNVSSLLQTEWGQGYPWNENSPEINANNCLMGCVAVAASQVLYYFNRSISTPNDLWHSISINSFTNGVVSLTKSQYTTNSSRWSQMPLSSSGTNTLFVSNLMLDLGERLHMQYGLSLSSAPTTFDNGITYLSDCGLSSSYSTYSYSTVKNDILNEKPVIVFASYLPSATLLHTWVIDGCKDYTSTEVITTTYYHIATEDIIYYPYAVTSYSDEDMLYLFPNAYNGMQILDTYYNSNKYLHMNWGYDGNSNGDYNVQDSNDWIYNPGTNGVNFQYARYIHYNLSPSQLY